MQDCLKEKIELLKTNIEKEKDSFRLFKLRLELNVILKELKRAKKWDHL
jgi:hypothetical protein